MDPDWMRLASRERNLAMLRINGARIDSCINNNNHLIHEVLPARYLGQNPFFPADCNVTQSVSDHGNAAEVYPITDNPEHQTLDGYRGHDPLRLVESPLIWVGHFPSHLDQVIFTAEPVSNLDSMQTF